MFVPNGLLQSSVSKFELISHYSVTLTLAAVDLF
jgi:hypothetical protein